MPDGKITKIPAFAAGTEGILWQLPAMHSWSSAWDTN